MPENEPRYVVRSHGPNNGYGTIFDSQAEKYIFGFESTIIPAKYVCDELNTLNRQVVDLKRKLARHHE